MTRLRTAPCRKKIFLLHRYVLHAVALDLGTP